MEKPKQKEYKNKRMKHNFTLFLSVGGPRWVPTPGLLHLEGDEDREGGR